jgi:hypothetical protein
MDTLVKNENTIITNNIKDIKEIYSTDNQKSKYKLEQIDYFKYINFILFYIYLLLFIGLLLLFIITKELSILIRIIIICILLFMLITNI